MAQPNPYFSIVIPTYNRADLIVETIDSVLKQSFSDFEVIIVDDGSTDDTGKVIERHYGGNAKVRYFHKVNGERGAARNYGMKKSLGRFAVFFDSDDWMYPHHLETLYQATTAHKNIGLFASRFEVKDAKGRVYASDISHLAEGSYDINLLLKGNYFACMYAINLEGNTVQPFLEDRVYTTLEDWVFLVANVQQHGLYLVGPVTIGMRQHDQRSMSDNLRVIRARMAATEWILRNISLNPEQQRTLKSYSAYFCGIHYYLDHDRSHSLQQGLLAIKTSGVNLLFVKLLLKSLAGKKMIESIKRYAK